MNQNPLTQTFADIMITRNTVLILGAGASMSYGFPSGEKLVDRIIDGLTSGPQRTVLSKILRGNHFPDHVIDGFVEDLMLSGRASIDAFLEHRTELIEFGKMAIAATLIPYEKQQMLFQTRPSWYSYLFNQLNANYDDFGKNALSVITFNYDRSLEHYLFTALKHAYSDKPDKEVVEQVRSIPIIHLHGSLGELPYFGTVFREYTSTINERSVLVASKLIRIIHEDLSNEPQFAQARNLLADADVIAFLGFGWNEENLNRLGIQYLTSTLTGNELYGTVFGRGQAEIEWVDRYFTGDIILAPSKIEDFLKDHPVLMDYPDPY